MVVGAFHFMRKKTIFKVQNLNPRAACKLRDDPWRTWSQSRQPSAAFMITFSFQTRRFKTRRLVSSHLVACTYVSMLKSPRLATCCCCWNEMNWMAAASWLGRFRERPCLPSLGRHLHRRRISASIAQVSSDCPMRSLLYSHSFQPALNQQNWTT